MHRVKQFVTLFVAGALLLAACGLGIFYLWSPRATLRITTETGNNLAARFIAALIAETEKAHPRIRFEPVTVPDLRASSKALETGKVNIALVRSDIAPPVNGNTLIILRRDVVAIIVSGKSNVENVSQLSGKTVAIPAGPMQQENSDALDLILNYFNVPPAAVQRQFLPMKEIGPEIHHGRVAAAVAVGPVGPGDIVDAVATIARATGSAPKILDFDDNDAIAARFPGLESISIPEGAFRARPPTPDDSVSGVAVTYRLVVPETMLNVVAGALGRSVMNAKGRLMALTPTANQIEAPDPSQASAILPVHPGFANYLNNGDQSFFDEAQTYLYVIGIPLSVAGSLFAVITSLVTSRRIERKQAKLSRLLTIATEVERADHDRIAELGREFDGIVSECMNDLLNGSTATDSGKLGLLIGHVGRVVERRTGSPGAADAANARGAPP